ncbi:MAG TPA: SDR family oxidoreductase [Geminicoccaceae bacterium]|nr:SDR family oxidoreductase [Geminicoccaceae bacterium]
MSGAAKAALVTGAAKRIGRALALDLAARGWDVAVHYRNSAADARAVVAEIAALGRRAVALAADLADEQQTRDLIGAATAALGPITLLVNNAAIFAYDRPETAGQESWQRHMAINLRAPLVLIQGLLAQLPAAGAANVVNVIDQRVLNLTPHYTSYTISKAGLWTLTQHLARALAPRIRVNAIAPGPVLPHAGMSTEEFEALCRATPLGRGTSLGEICRALGLILDAPAMTGQMITLDGGRHLGWLLPEEG